MQDIYIEFGDIKGSSTDKTHTECCEPLSWSHGFTQTTSPTRSTAGAGTVERAHHSDFNFTKYIDAASAGLMKACWGGTHIPAVKVHCYRANTDGGSRVKYLLIEMDVVVISNFSLSVGAGSLPVENISLSYKKITYTYSAQATTDGSGTGQKPVHHDLSTNEVG